MISFAEASIFEDGARREKEGRRREAKSSDLIENPLERLA
jgi:hypothetical protein